MADPSTPERAERKHVGGELVIPVAALLFTLYYFWTIIDVPWTGQVSALFVGVILLVLIAIFFVRVVLAVRRGEADLDLEVLTTPISFVPKRLALLGLTLGFIVVIRWLGFTLTTFLFLSLSMLLLGGMTRVRVVIPLAAVCALGGYLLFIVAFETRFPRGPFEALLKGLW